MRHQGVSKHGRGSAGGVAAILLPGVCLVGVLVALGPHPAWSATNKLELAREYFDKARAQHTELEKIPVEKRTEKDYTTLVQAYRRVYYTAPTYGNATICLMAIGGLSEEAARRLGKPQYFQQAIEAYEFLLKEYPHSQFRFEALLAIARIYRQDLQDPAKALVHYERYRKMFPGSAQARQAEIAIAQLKDDLAGQPAAAEKPAAAAPATAVATNDRGTAPGNSVAPRQPAKPGNPSTVTDVRFWRTPEYTRVVLELGTAVKYDVGRVESPERLYLDLFDTRVSPASGKTYPVEDGMLKSIRVAQFNATTSRVVLDLADKTEFAISELTNPYRLVVDVRSNSQPITAELLAAKTTPAASPPPPRAKWEPPAPPQPPLLPERAPAPAKAAEPSPEPVKVAEAAPTPALDKIKPADPMPGGAHSLTRALGLKIGRILIDPGHGGHDTGTIGPAGYTEKELVLDISRRLGKLIEDRLGSEVIYTREEDHFISLEDRARMANQKQADLFVSIHANSSRSKTTAGIETYYLSLTSDPEALEVAARENAVSQETISELQGLVQKIALHEKVDESKEFATKVHAALRTHLAKGRPARFDRGVKKAPFVVLIGADMPAILAEVSFLSNPEEEKRLKTPEHRQKIAEALYDGVAAYAETLSGVKPAPTRAASGSAANQPTQTASLE